MSYPMNEFVTDLKDPPSSPEGEISSSASAAVPTHHKTGHEISSLLKRTRNGYRSIRSRAGNKADRILAMMHRSPRATVLAGISAGVLLGFLAACRLNGRSA